MAIKEELASDIKEEGGGEDELAALDALEAEAKEFDKVALSPALAPDFHFLSIPSQTS